MFSLKLIAEQLGVSSATVSNALNQKGKMSPELRQRIIRLARENGYQISPHALALQGKRLNILGLMMGGIDDGLGQELFLGTELAAQENDYSTILAVSAHAGMNHDEAELRSVSRFQLLRIGGVLYLPAADTEHLKVETFLRKNKIPYVLLYRRCSGDQSPAVVVDHVHGFRLALKHLQELGHRQISVVYDPNYRGPELEDACQVFRELLPGLVWEQYCVGLDADLAGHMQSSGTTAFVALSDFIAWSIAEQLKKQGIECPRHFSLVGFRDTLIARTMSPKLTTLNVNAQNMAYTASQWLIQQISLFNRGKGEGAAAPSLDVSMPPSLLIRESCAPPPL